MESPRPHGSRKKWWFLGATAAIAALAILPPYLTLNRFQRRLESAMSQAIGRRVTVQQVHPNFLPQPGFELGGLVVEDDPDFSSEPLLRADEVTANLRLTSLWRGRVELSKLSLREPSLNLVRNREGRWNVEPLLTHAAQVPAAPTGTVHAEARPRFPYVQADNGRINFKFGNEKKVFALSDADFALWLASESEWGMRLEARPIRTDADLGDTGTLRISGRFQRGPVLRESPVRINGVWEKAQLGQLTQLIYGRDRGWRGRVDVEALFSGIPSSLNMAGKISVGDFRRYDIAGSDSFNAQAACDAIYQAQAPDMPATAGVLRGNCTLSRGSGLLNLRGNIVPSSGAIDLTLMAASFPVSPIAALARHMKRDLAPDLDADGSLNGSVTWRRGWPDQEARSRGPHDVNTFTFTAQTTLKSQALGQPMNLGVLVFTVDPSAPQNQLSSREKTTESAAPITLLPTRLPLGGVAPLMLSASVGPYEYQLTLKGDADIAQLQSFLRTLGLPAAPAEPAAAGRAKVDLQIGGDWAGFPSPNMVGAVRLPATVTAARRSPK